MVFLLVEREAGGRQVDKRNLGLVKGIEKIFKKSKKRQNANAYLVVKKTV